MSERVLSVSGLRAELRASRHEPQVWTLEIDGTPQSQVDLSDLGHLAFEYVRRIGFAIDALAPERQPLTALHLGAGALTLPRYVDATRPGSRQQVIEIEPDLIELVREALPLPKQASIRIRIGDAREALGKLPVGLQGNVDLTVVDIFSGARTPAHVTSLEFHSLIPPLMTSSGLVAVNIADGHSLSFAKRQLATLSAVWEHVAFAANTSLLKGRRFGNVVAYASQAPLPLEALQRQLAGDAFPAKLVHGTELTQFIGSASVVHDTDAVASPLPGRTVFLTS
ncbi:MAG: spermidine synthase [Agromyces sp.]